MPYLPNFFPEVQRSIPFRQYLSILQVKPNVLNNHNSPLRQMPKPTNVSISTRKTTIRQDQSPFRITISSNKQVPQTPPFIIEELHQEDIEKEELDDENEHYYEENDGQYAMNILTNIYVHPGLSSEKFN